MLALIGLLDDRLEAADDLLFRPREPFTKPI
jgi:hypothetical protein